MLGCPNDDDIIKYKASSDNTTLCALIQLSSWHYYDHYIAASLHHYPVHPVAACLLLIRRHQKVKLILL